MKLELVRKSDEFPRRSQRARKPRPAQQPGPGIILKLFYSREEAAMVLALSVREIDGLISRQVLTTRPYGRRRLIPAADVNKVAGQILGYKMVSKVAEKQA